MRAVVLHETGPAENLRLEDIPKPSPTRGHALIRVRAAGVCHRDVIDRKGGFPFMKKPVVPGHEFAGEIAELGEGVDGLAVGDRVVNMLRAPCGECSYCRAGHEPCCQQSLEALGLTVDGCYAEYVVVDVRCLVRLPNDIPYEQSCFLSCTAGTALRGLRARANLQPGERVLITGASGGVGAHGIQIAKALGAEVIAVTSSEAKVDALRSYGADEVVVSPDGAFHKKIKRVHVVLECVGAPTMHASIKSVVPMGRVVVCGNVTISRAEINPGYFILQEVSLMGTHVCGPADMQDLFAWVKDGALKPIVADTIPLDRAADAHRRLEAKAVSGRIVLTP